MRKFLSLLVALATVTMAWAAQGGTLTSSKTPIDPTQTVTLTYDGTGTNFANWEPSCFIHAWLVAADGQTLSKSYSTDWASCNGDGDYASLASKLKMTYSGTKGKYTISMNIKEFFNVADADLPKIGKLGVIVRAQYEGDNNKTNDMFVNVAYTTPAAGTSVTYTVESTSKVNVTGTAPEGSSATYASTYTTKCQLTSGKSMTLTLSGFEGNKITGITLSMKSNKSGGKGSFTAVAGTTTIASIADAAFNTASWNGAWSTEYVDVIPTMTKSDYTVQKDENVVITIAASANSLYCQSFTVYYDKGATPPTPVDSTTLYFVNTLDWANVKAFVWPASGDAYKAWSGEAMKKTADKVNGKDVYSYTFPSSFVNVIFNNGTDQTADLAWAAAKPYFVPGAKNAAGKYEGTWYASKDDIPAPELPAKYYITGDSALVVDAGLAADKAWAPAAIKADADTTVLNLKAGVDYKLKVTVDGTWSTALGYDALSEKAEGLIADADGNICFKLAEAGAVQVVYFKAGDVVTFKVLGKFYIKPVIVETLKLVPNMWSEAGAKMAAWVWGDDLAGAWTPFFAGEGDTLSVKIDEQADSVVFVRFASDVTAPAWDATLWNRVKDEEIDHVGLTYTITAWGDEGVSVGQWTPYEPAGGCDWDNLPWLGSALPAYAEQFKICLGDPKPGVVNIQESFGTQAGIYVTFPSAAFGQISLSEGQYAIQGAGMLLYVSAFTAKETEVSVVCENVEYLFTVYNAKGGEPVCKDKYGLKVGDNVVEFAKNEAQTEWVEYYKQGVELTAGDVIVLYNICEDQTFAAKVAGYEGLTPLVGGDGWTVTETAKYDFYLKLIYGADELYVVKQGDTPVEGKYFITGDSALVVDAGLTADKAWAPAAIKADADTTVLNLKAGVEYKLKVTVDGTWATALGYNALSEKTEGLIADGDDNICFKLTEAGAVQVIYFKEGDVVTFKVLGNFYIKPVIVETLKLVPNMWSEAGAKMAAWVWGEGLAGAWTPFFAGEGDTLSVKINAEADSIIFVRMNSDATEPDWAKEWNRVKDEEIDHVGLTYTITDWDKGQWTPYEPAGGCDWDNLPWLGSALPAYAEQFKICLGDPKPGVVNIQESFGTQAGIYVTFPSAAFGQISLSEGQYAIQGAGMLLYVSAFTAKETEVSVVCENVEYVFTIYNDKGGEPVCEGKYGLKVGDNVVEFTKNEAQTEWTEYYKQGVELTQGQFIALYNICEETAFTATIAGYEGFTPATGGWTVTETAKYDFYLKLIYGADELYVVKQGSGDAKFYMKNNWNAGADWTWKKMTKDGDNYKLENVVFGGSGVNYNTSETDEGAAWVEVADILGDKIAAKDTVTFVLNPTAKTVTATIVGKYIPTGDVQYFMKNNWNAGADWTWKEMTKDGDNYKLENVVYGGTGVNYNTEATDANATWVAEADIKGDKLGAKDTVNLVLNPVAGTVTATIVGKYVDPTPGDKVYTIVGVADLVGVEWNPEATDNDMAKQADGSYILVKNNVVLAVGTYDYKVVEGHSWDGWQIPAQGNQTLKIQEDGTYNVTFTLDAALTTLTATAINVGPAPAQEYGLMINGTTFVKADLNPATPNEYMALGVELTAGQTLQVFDKANNVGWVITNWNEGSYKFNIENDKYVVTETAKYDFYFKMEYGNDYIYVAKQGTPTDPKVEVWGDMNDWAYGLPMTLSEDKTKATISANIDPDTYEFKIMVNGEWRSNAQTFTRQNNSAVGITMNENDNMKFVADIKGDYTVTWIFATNELSIVYPTSTAIENLVAPANDLRKVMIDGKLYILRDGKVYSVQGQLIR